MSVCGTLRPFRCVTTIAAGVEGLAELGGPRPFGRVTPNRVASSPRDGAGLAEAKGS